MDKNDWVMFDDLYISGVLVSWYGINKRKLPWRETDNPYIIWISEVILQQTRVNQGQNYFLRFVGRYPDVFSLAEATGDEVLKLWQGLGYYSRARNLHTAAKTIVSEYKGIFPDTYNEIIKLKGVGEYTAAAIASFAYNLPYAVVDGNVFRVLSRLFAIEEPVNTVKGKKYFTDIAQKILDKANPGMHNQAIMEFGALHCTPVNPKCSNCPLSGVCRAYEYEKVSRFPVKQGIVKKTKRYFNYLNIHYNGNVYIKKREQQDIWKNLYELPLIETSAFIEAGDLIRHKEFFRLFGTTRIGIKKEWETKHILSHQVISASFYRIDILDDEWKNEFYYEVPEEKIHDFPVSRLVHKYIEKLF